MQSPNQEQLDGMTPINISTINPEKVKDQTVERIADKIADRIADKIASKVQIRMQDSKKYKKSSKIEPEEDDKLI